MVESGAAAPEKSHVRSKDFVARTYEVIAAPSLNIDETVGRVVHTVKEDLCTSRMSSLGHPGNVDDRAEGVRRGRARNETRLRRKKRLKVGQVQIAILAHFPPADDCARLLQSQPSCDVGFMIKLAHDDLPAVSKCLTERQAHEANE